MQRENKLATAYVHQLKSQLSDSTFIFILSTIWVFLW